MVYGSFNRLLYIFTEIVFCKSLNGRNSIAVGNLPTVESQFNCNPEGVEEAVSTTLSGSEIFSSLTGGVATGY